MVACCSWILSLERYSTALTNQLLIAGIKQVPNNFSLLKCGWCHTADIVLGIHGLVAHFTVVAIDGAQAQVVTDLFSLVDFTAATVA
jgi:hypothetical protein